MRDNQARNDMQPAEASVLCAKHKLECGGLHSAGSQALQAIAQFRSHGVDLSRHRRSPSIGLYRMAACFQQVLMEQQQQIVLRQDASRWCLVTARPVDGLRAPTLSSRVYQYVTVSCMHSGACSIARLCVLNLSNRLVRCGSFIS